jgi:hypothetical protein
MVEKSEFFRLIDEVRDFGQELRDLCKALASIASIASMEDAVQLRPSRARGQTNITAMKFKTEMLAEAGISTANPSRRTASCDAVEPLPFVDIRPARGSA